MISLMRLVGPAVVGCAMAVSLATPAHAERMIRRTPPVQRCPNRVAWEEIAHCLTGIGRFTIERQIASAKVVRFELGTGSSHGYNGTYVYADVAGKWELIGQLESNAEAHYDLLEPVRIGRTTGFHVRQHSVQPILAYREDGVSDPGVLVQDHDAYCAPHRGFCVTAPTSCDVLVDGNARWSFRGELKLTPSSIDVLGDRSHATTYCSVPEHVYLGWGDEQ